MTDIVFLDTETLGLHPDAPIWEFAAIRRRPDSTEDQCEFFIRHDQGDWLADLDEQFADDYRNRFLHTDAFDEHDAAIMVHLVTRDAIMVGANPSFDLQRLEKLLTRYHITPEWHYRPICVTTMAATGLHAARAAGRRGWMGDGERFDTYLDDLLTLPWSSDKLSRAIEVNPDDYQRHTAMGDAKWVRAQWDAITEHNRPEPDPPGLDRLIDTT